MAIGSTRTSAPPIGRELCVPQGKPRVVLISPRGDILSACPAQQERSEIPRRPMSTLRKGRERKGRVNVMSNYELQSLLNEWSIPSSKTQDRPSSGAISPCRRRVPGQCSAHTQCAEYSVGRESMATHLCLPVYHTFCPALFKLAGPKVGSLKKK